MAVLNASSINTIDHMTHVDNLAGILAHGLLAHNNPHKKVDISNEMVNQRRHAKEPVYSRSIHDYVPFYFNARNAMLYRNQKQFSDAVIVLGFNKRLIEAPKTVFANANASCAATKFFGNPAVLNTFNWERIFSPSWCNHGVYNEQLKKDMMAEVLVHKHVKRKHLKVIYCNSRKMRDYIRANIALCDVKLVVSEQHFF